MEIVIITGTIIGVLLTLTTASLFPKSLFYLPIIFQTFALAAFGIAALASLAFYITNPKNLWMLIPLTISVIMLFMVSPNNIAVKSEQSNLTVYHHNILWDNSQVREVPSKIAEINPDIIFISEYNNKNHYALELEKEYPYSYYLNENYSISDTAIYSKLPLYDTKVIFNKHFPVLSAKVKVNQTEIELIGIHTISPVKYERYNIWEQELSELEAYLTSLEHPFIIAGDFNANYGHPEFRKLTEKANLSSPSINPLTWRANGFTPAITQLDHILVRGIKYKSFNVGDYIGSDHKSIYAQLYVE